MTERLFTLEEAQELVPWLQEIFDAIEPLKAELDGAETRAKELVIHMQSNGGTRTRKEMEEASRTQQVARQRIDEQLQKIADRGIVIRTADQGLVDFPSKRDGRTVYLCWLAGEPTITHWHDLDTGFAGRQPL